MARASSHPVLDSHGKRVKNLTYRETANGRVFEQTVYIAGKGHRRPLVGVTSQEEAVRLVKRAETLDAAAKLDGPTIARAMRLGEIATIYFDLTEEYIAREEALGPDPSYRGLSSPATLVTYKTNYRKYVEPFFGGKKLVSEVTGPKVSAFFRWLRTQPGRSIKSPDGIIPTTLSEGSLNSIKSTLAAILGEARNQGAMTANPLSSLPPRDLPRQRVRPDYVKTKVRKEQLFAIIEQAHGRRRTRVTTAVLTGMRASEVVGLVWADVRLDEGHIYLTGSLGINGKRRMTKTGVNRKIALLPEVVAALKNQRVSEWQKGLGREEDFVFTSDRPWCHGQAVTRLTLLRDIKIAAAAAGIETLDLRAVRRSVATWLANSEMPHHTAASMMGHSEEVFRNVYVQTHDDRAETQMIVAAMQEAENA